MDSTNKLDIANIKSRITQLPTLPTVVTKVLQLINNPKSSAEDISRYIENDIALSSMVLKLANSSYYGIPQTVSSIQTAIVIMGQNSLKTLVIPVSMVQMFPDAKPNSKISWEQFWVHSVETAVFARAISQMIPCSLEKEQIFTAGLLHDVGRLILNQLNSQAFDLVVKEVSEGGDWRLSEMKHFGFGAAEVGDALFDSWNFPESIREPVRSFTQPEQAGRSVQSAWIINLAQRLSMVKGSLMVENEIIPGVNGEAMAILGIKGTEEELLEKLAPDLNRAAAFLNLFQDK